MRAKTFCNRLNELCSFGRFLNRPGSVSRKCHTEVREALIRFDPLWDELLPAEQTRIVRLLVQRVEIGINRMHVHLCVEGLSQFASELTQREAA